MNLRAAIIVDFQRDFAHKQGQLYVQECDLIGEELTRLADCSPVVVLTKCWHAESDASFKQNGGEWPTHCLRSSWGADMDEKFKSKNQALILHKVGYSPFFNAPGITSGLYEWLDGMGVEALDIGGVALEYCVKHCVLDALQLGFEVAVHQGAVAAINSAGRQTVFETLRLAGATII